MKINHTTVSFQIIHNVIFLKIWKISENQKNWEKKRIQGQKKLEVTCDSQTIWNGTVNYKGWTKEKISTRAIYIQNVKQLTTEKKKYKEK